MAGEMKQIIGRRQRKRKDLKKPIFWNQHMCDVAHVILYTMQLKDGSSLAVVSGCPSRGNGHTGVKGKAAQAALLQQCWEDR